MKKCIYCDKNFNPKDSDFEDFCKEECVVRYNDEMYPDYSLED